QADFELLIVERVALPPYGGEDVLELAPRAHRVFGVRAKLGAIELGIELVRLQMREQYASERGAVCGHTAADAERHGHDPLRRRARDEDDGALIQHCDGTGLIERAAHFLEKGLRRDRHRLCGKVRVSEVENLRLKEKSAAVRARIAELAQRVEAAPYDGPREPGHATHIGDRHAAVRSGERANDVKPARQRGHEIRVTRTEEWVILAGAHFRGYGR